MSTGASPKIEESDIEVDYESAGRGSTGAASGTQVGHLGPRRVPLGGDYHTSIRIIDVRDGDDGDATCSDSKRDGHEEKIRRVGSSYVKYIACIFPTGNLYPCHTPASLVIIPTLPDGLEKALKMADDRDIVLRPFAPVQDGVPNPAAATIARIVESLL